MQVADVHRGLLSLSRCADLGFEGRFGRIAGALICERTGDYTSHEERQSICATGMD